MASSLFKSRLLDFSSSSPSIKLYGYKSISREEEKTLIERLCRPTMSLLQAQISTHANYQNQNEALDLSSVNCNAENIPLSLGDYASQVSTNYSIDTETQSVSSISSSRLVDLRSVNDYEKVADKLNKLVELWNRNSKVNKLSPPCACERGAVLLREDSEKWVKHSQSQRSSRCSNICHHHHHQCNIEEPVDWEIVNRIVRRLHSSRTAGSDARQKESRILLKMLAKRKMPNTAPTSNSHPHESNQQFSKPGLQSNLFDSRCKFKPKQFINQWETLQVNNHLLNRISRPTTSSQLKRRIGCIICDAKPSAKTSLGVVNTYSKNDISYPTSHCFHNKKEETELVERILQPTIASQADKCRCKRSYRFEPHSTTTRKISSQPNNSSTIELSGESIIHRLNNSNKQLPLISGLERSSSINSIVHRLYSGKCQRINCHVNKQVKQEAN